METITFTSDGLRLSGELYVPGGAGCPGLCICHGIPARPYDPEDRGYAVLAEHFCREGFAVLLFYFRGAGRSEGNFDMAGWTRDLEQAMGVLDGVPQVDSSRMFVMGFSGGAAAALCATPGDPRVAGVVSCASPADFDDLLPGTTLEAFLAEWRRIGIIRDESFPADMDAWADGFTTVSPAACIASIAPRPVLLLHGDADEVVPVAHAYRLYEAAGEPKDLEIIPGGLHRLRVDERAMDKALAWLRARTAG
jgi:dipeptidyl aminopeptidase/acylaminoacyl peptidase